MSKNYKTKPCQNAKHKAINYLNSFVDELQKADNINDYYESVLAVLIYAELVEEHFKELYMIDADTPETMLSELRTAAKAIARETTESNKPESN